MRAAGDDPSNRSPEPAADPVVVRPARAADYAAIVALWRAANLPFRPQGRDNCEAYLRQLARFQGLYLVAETKNGLVGVVFGTHDERKGWINRLAVEPDWQRQGVAGALVRACEAGLKALGISMIAALVEADNTESQAFFEGMGYRTDVPVCYYRKLGNPEV